MQNSLIASSELKPPESKQIMLRRGLLFLVPIFNVLWYPLFQPSFGQLLNVTASDVLLVVCWLVASIGYLQSVRRKTLTSSEILAWKVVLLANVPILLSFLASFLVSESDNLVSGILAHIKRIGLAAVLIPLAVQAEYWRVKVWSVISFFLSVCILYFGSATWTDAVTTAGLIVQTTDRATGTLFNPNSLAFVTSISLLVFLAAFMDRKQPRVLRLCMPVGMFLSFLLFESSGSRAATLGFIAAFLYFSWRIRVQRRLLIGIAVILVVGLFVIEPEYGSGVLGERWQLVAQYGTEEENLAARLELQTISLLDSVTRPIGVGINSYKMQYTDSLYIDYLNAMGFLGLLSIICLLRLSWRGQSGNSDSVILSKAVLIDVAIFSLSALGLASSFVSPIAFLLIGFGLSSRVVTEPTNNEIVSKPLARPRSSKTWSEQL